jgi:hypothetical protein
MPSANRATKDPSAILDYQVDWTPWLNGADSITTSTWVVPTGLTLQAESNDAAIATAWISGGTAGQTYRMVNRIVTTGGRTDERSIHITVDER